MDLLRMLPADIQLDIAWRAVQLLQISTSGALMIVVAVILRSLALYRLPKKTLLVTWGLVLARLLIPFDIPSPYSFHTLFYQRAAGGAEVAAVTSQPTAAVSSGTLASSAPAPAQSPPLSLMILSVWLVGLIGCAVYFLVMTIRCRRVFQASFPVQSEYIDQWLAELPCRRTVSVRQTGRISAPLSYGIFRPVILLPRSFPLEDETTLRYVLTHELVHIRRFDVLTKGIIILAVCVHWFNPMVWIMYILANRDIELACDESVIQKLGKENKSDYAMALLCMVEAQFPITSAGNHFSRTAIEERIAAMSRSGKTSMPAVAAVLILTAVSTIAFATSPQITIWEHEEWATEYWSWVTQQAAADCLNGEMMSERYELIKLSYMESYVSPPRVFPITRAIAELEWAIEQLGPGETRHVSLEQDGCRIEIDAQPDYHIEIYDRNGSPLASLSSDSYEWEFTYTAKEQQFLAESDFLYRETWQATEEAGITEAATPFTGMSILDSYRFYFGGLENVRRLAGEIQSRVERETDELMAEIERTGMIPNGKGELVPVSSLTEIERRNLEERAISQLISPKEAMILLEATAPNSDEVEAGRKAAAHAAMQDNSDVGHP